MTKENILSKLSEFHIAKIDINGRNVKLQIQLLPNENALEQEKIVKNRLPNYDVQVIFVMQDEGRKKFKKIIGISSGKGGVGKSSIALHLAFALKEMGYKIGILDADIYAPSMPVFLNVDKNPISQDGRLIEPIIVNDFQLLSMGLFLQKNQAAMWRGPMLASAFSQFLEQGAWECDYLIVDFPPGTTDIHMSCAKVAPDINMVLVSTPSKVVYADVMRMYVVLRALNLKVLGMVENMAYSICNNCSHKEYFKTTASIEGVEKLIEMPIFHHFHELAEMGYENYTMREEKAYFEELANKIIKKE